MSHEGIKDPCIIRQTSCPSSVLTPTGPPFRSPPHFPPVGFAQEKHVTAMPRSNSTTWRPELRPDRNFSEIMNHVDMWTYRMTPSSAPPSSRPLQLVANQASTQARLAHGIARDSPASPERSMCPWCPSVHVMHAIPFPRASIIRTSTR